MADEADAEAAKASRRVYTQADGLPHSFGSLTPSADGATLYMLGGSPDRPGGVYSWSGLDSAAAAAASGSGGVRTQGLSNPGLAPCSDWSSVLEPFSAVL